MKNPQASSRASVRTLKDRPQRAMDFDLIMRVFLEGGGEMDGELSCGWGVEEASAAAILAASAKRPERKAEFTVSRFIFFEEKDRLRRLVRGICDQV